MALIEPNWNPSQKELRNFAAITLVATFLLAVLLHWRKGMDLRWALVIVAFGLILFLSQFLSLKIIRLFYIGLISLTLPIGLVMSFLVLAAFFFTVITPISLFFRLIRRDTMRRRWDPTDQSYWQPHTQPKDLKRYYRQF